MAGHNALISKKYLHPSYDLKLRSTQDNVLIQAHETSKMDPFDCELVEAVLGLAFCVAWPFQN